MSSWISRNSYLGRLHYHRPSKGKVQCWWIGQWDARTFGTPSSTGGWNSPRLLFGFQWWIPGKKSHSTSHSLFFNLTLQERAKTQTSTKIFEEVWNLVYSTLRVPVGQSGWEWYHCSSLALGYMVSSRKSSICEVLFKLLQISGTVNLKGMSPSRMRLLVVLLVLPLYLLI